MCCKRLLPPPLPLGEALVLAAIVVVLLVAPLPLLKGQSFL